MARQQRTERRRKSFASLFYGNCAQDCLFANGNPTEHFVEDGEQEGQERERDGGMKETICINRIETLT